MGQEIMFEVFCNRYQKAYVGENLEIKEIESITVEQVAKSLNDIKMQYRDNRLGEVVTTTPNKFYKKMTEYIPILTDDANKWTFCLPNVYYTALTADMRAEIQLQGYKTPQPSLLPTKEDQLHSMSNCRTIAVVAVKKVKLYEDKITSLISSTITGMQAAGHHLQPQVAHHPHWDQISNVNPCAHSPQVNTYNPLSWAEDTI